MTILDKEFWNQTVQSQERDYLLRIEAVNFERTLFDTAQLSVIRGTSMLMRDAVRREPENQEAEKREPKNQTTAEHSEASMPTLEALIKKEYPNIKFKPIATGASVGLYQFRAAPWKAERVQKYVHGKLNEGDNIGRHLSFVVDIEPIRRGDFVEARERVTARNRFRQMQQLSLPLAEGEGARPCDLEGLRPADTKKIGNERASDSVWERYRYGVDQKQAFFYKETGNSKLCDLKFANDFSEIAGMGPGQKKNHQGKGSQPAPDPKPEKTLPPLAGKLAIIYFDGNNFGNLQQACKSPEELDKFDVNIQECRKQYLNEFLTEIKDVESFKTQPSRKELAFELLRWGGDEILMVVPARCGFFTLQYFYEAAKDWQWNGTPLTHAGALIFCQHKTPIDRMTELAHEIVDLVKESPEGRSRNLFDYVVLESIDFPAEPLPHFWIQRYGALADRRKPLAPVDLQWRIQKVRNFQKTLKNPIPRSRLEPLVRGLAVPRGDERMLQKQQQQLDALIEGKQHAEDKHWSSAVKTCIEALFPGQDSCWQWLHLIELWDYLVAPESLSHATNASQSDA